MVEAVRGYVCHFESRVLLHEVVVRLLVGDCDDELVDVRIDSRGESVAFKLECCGSGGCLPVDGVDDGGGVVIDEGPCAVRGEDGIEGYGMAEAFGTCGWYDGRITEVLFVESVAYEVCPDHALELLWSAVLEYVEHEHGTLAEANECETAALVDVFYIMVEDALHLIVHLVVHAVKLFLREHSGVKGVLMVIWSEEVEVAAPDFLCHVCQFSIDELTIGRG